LSVNANLEDCRWLAYFQDNAGESSTSFLNKPSEQQAGTDNCFCSPEMVKRSLVVSPGCAHAFMHDPFARGNNSSADPPD
jgi:hypothetical protein